MEQTMWVLESDTESRVQVQPHVLSTDEGIALQSGGTIMLGIESFHLVNGVDD